MQKTTNTVGHVFRICHNVRIDIYKQHTECDRYKKQRLKFMLNRKIQEEASHCDHNVIAPVQIKTPSGEAGCLKFQ